MRALGLRAQIVLALAGLSALAFVPLFFAVASLTRVTLQTTRETAARALGRSVAGHVANASADDRASLDAEVGPGGVEALCVFGGGGERIACAGDGAEVARLAAPRAPVLEETHETRGARGRVLDVIVPRAAGGAVVARVRTDDTTDRTAPLVRLVAGYMTAFAVALAFLAYAALTRLIVRPIEGLASAADRVASGGRTAAGVEVPKRGAREMAELGASVQAMATRLLADEAALRKKVDELEAASRRLTDAQTQVVRSERLASVGRLAAGVAHEIGNPIAAIMGMQDLLLEGGLSEGEQQDFLRRMKKESERINLVLRDLLDFARPERAEPASGSGSPRASVAAAADDALALVRTQKSMKGAALDVRVAPEHVACIAPSRLVQVLLNLTLNAADAMQEEPEAKRHLTIASAVEDDRIRIDVSDTGPGIAPSIASRLFEPFVTTKEPGQGTGLGLAVCRGIVEGAGGTIELDAQYAGGARFVVRLPRA